MVIPMNFSAAVRNELGRALRNFKYDKTPNGILFPASGLLFGGVFGAKVDDGAWEYGPNAVGNEFINDVLNAKFNNTAGAASWYFAPFINNLAPTSSLKASQFANMQGEYEDYTEAARQPWVSNGPSTAQSVSNSNSAAVITIGGTPATIVGSGLLSAAAKGATTGEFGAGGLFGIANTLSPGSKLMMTYALSAAST